MKQKIKQMRLAIVGLFLSTTAFAHDFSIGGIYYNYLDETAKTVAVTYRGSSYNSYYDEYSGSVTIPSSVTYSGTTYSVTSIGSYAFYNCTGLTSITIPNSVTSIGYDAFYDCYGLTSVTIGNSVTSIGNYAFEGCTGLTEVNISDLSAWCKIDFSDSSANPLCYAKKLKLNGAEIKDLVIPNNITEIKNYAFSGCDGLTSITIPNSVTSIGNYAFNGCSGLTSITIPNSIISIGDRAFRDCTGLTSITIPNSVTSIGTSAFTGTAWYNNLADGVIYINNVLYEYKGSMPNGTSISVKDGTVSISPYAFSRCSGLTSVTIPNSVTSIGPSAFYGCTGLTSVTIPNSVSEIGSYAFEGCSGLTKLILEDGTESISRLSFPSSPIETLYLGRNTSDTFVKGKTTLKEVTIGNSVTSIGNKAFEGCTGLTSITIPNSVTAIGNDAFYGCSNLIESNNVISPTSVKVNLNTLCSSNLVPCIAINNKYYTNNTLVESLDPEYSYNYDLGLQFKDNFILIGSSSFLTGELELTTQAAKATSSSSVRLIATTNCDATTSTGFEWRRYDAPAEMPSNKVSCPIVDGMLVGTLRGLRDDAYYKYRPFYTSASGKTYYGEWIAFFTGDANVYFEPEVQTYSDYAITDNSVVVKGYVLEGTDEITAQGFEYWKTGSTILPSSTENRMTVTASGITMSATLANLEYNSTYKYRAFVTTAKGTTYGDEVEFETGNDPVGVESIIIDKSATEVFEIARYDIHGRLLSKPSRGINIIIYSDGTTRKEIIK